MAYLSVKDANIQIKKRLSLISSLDIKYKDPYSGRYIKRSKIIDAKGLTTIRSKVRPTDRVSTLKDEIGKVCGAQLGAEVELSLAGKKVDGRLMVDKLM